MDGLAADFTGTMTVGIMDALDGDTGERAFEASGLPGHPGYVLLAPDGQELWRGFGQQEPDALRRAVQAALPGG